VREEIDGSELAGKQQLALAIQSRGVARKSQGAQGRSIASTLHSTGGSSTFRMRGAPDQLMWHANVAHQLETKLNQRL